MSPQTERRILDWLETPMLSRGEFLVFVICTTVLMWAK